VPSASPCTIFTLSAGKGSEREVQVDASADRLTTSMNDSMPCQACSNQKKVEAAKDDSGKAAIRATGA